MENYSYTYEPSNRKRQEKLKWQQKRVRGANKNKYISENWLDK